MTTEAKKAPAKSNKGKSLTPEECYNQFQTLRSEQRNLINTLQELEMDLNEHKVVVNAMKDLEGDRKCFRLVGGVLCEQTVEKVLPFLRTTQEQLAKMIDNLNEQVTKKGAELNEYKEKHNIRISGQDVIIPSSPGEVEPKDSAKTSKPTPVS